MIKVLARPTNNAEQRCGQRKERNFKCEHFKNFRWFAWDFWLPPNSNIHLLSFASMW